MGALPQPLYPDPSWVLALQAGQKRASHGASGTASCILHLPTWGF